MNIVFDKNWFNKHQRGLLFLCNAPMIKYWFRWVLKIHRYCSFKEQIVEIQPNNYKVYIGNGQIRADFRTHNKFAKRLYYAFYPLWALFHIWDLFADRYTPQLSFGFATLAAFPDAGDPGTTSVDGIVGRAGLATPEAWSTIRAGAGNFSRVTGFGTGEEYMGTMGTSAAGGQNWITLTRFIMLFDTSSLGSGSTITAGSVVTRGTAKQDANGWAPTLNIYTSTPASNTTLADSDYANVGNTAQAGVSIPYVIYSTTGDNTWTLTVLTNISKTGVTKFCSKLSYDTSDTNPADGSSANETQFECRSADYTGTSDDPTLNVTYTPAPVTSTSKGNLLLMGVG